MEKYCSVALQDIEQMVNTTRVRSDVVERSK
jgi:hypothetical protein